MQKTYDVILDMEKDLYSPSNLLFEVSKNDYQTIYITFTITQDNAAFDLTGSEIELAVKKPSGLTTFQNLTITDAAAGKATCVLTLQSYTEYGVCSSEVYVRNAGQMMVTCPFYFSVRDSIMDSEEVTSIGDFTALQAILFGLDRKPLLVEGVPAVLPEYIGQLAFDTIGFRTFIANGFATDSWQILGVKDITQLVVAWTNVTGKPAFYPAEAHTHAIADVLNLQTALDSKADVVDIPSLAPYLTQAESDARYQQIGTDVAPDWTEITGKPATFDPSEHLHAIGDVTGLQAVLDSKADDADLTGMLTTTEADARYQQLGTDIAADWTTITNKPATFTPSPHTHAIADVTGLQTSLDAKANLNSPTFTGVPAAPTPAAADNSTTLATTAFVKAQGYLTAAPAPAWGGITGTLANQTDLQTALNAKANAADLGGKKLWSGTQAAYDAITTKDANTLYFISG